MRVYLDCNVYCRPLDDQSQTRIRAEAEAFLNILSVMGEKEIVLLSSDILKFEVRAIPSVTKRRAVERLLEICSEHISESNEVLNLAESLENDCNLHGRDAVHIASAVLGRAQFFLTCDEQVVRKSGRIEDILRAKGHGLRVLNPVSFNDRVIGGHHGS
ncbi:MAG: hypothetical protein HY204_10035 [Nitrospirae bacterium]|nr:hypothetical protein [Nitrospirota bacterium]